MLKNVLTTIQPQNLLKKFFPPDEVHVNVAAVVDGVANFDSAAAVR